MQSSCQDATFFIDDTTRDNTGNYSCVFSLNKLDLQNIKGYGLNGIFITVNGKNISGLNHANNPQLCIYF